MTIDTSWQQSSGDHGAATYGATFTQLDRDYMHEDTYDCTVVEVLNMRETCGDDWKSSAESIDGNYYVSTYYVDVDDLPLDKIRAIMACNGWTSAHNTPCSDVDGDEVPEHIAARLQEINAIVADLRRLRAWNVKVLSAKYQAQLDDLLAEHQTLTLWYAIPRRVRAVEAASYGGYESDDYTARTFATLREAMESRGIPASALWNSAEYEKSDPFADDDSEDGDSED